MSCLGQTPEKSSLSLHSPDLSGHAPEILKQFPQSYSTLEASLLVPDFTIPVYGSSCHSLFFGLIIAVQFFGIPKEGWDAKK